LVGGPNTLTEHLSNNYISRYQYPLQAHQLFYILLKSLSKTTIAKRIGFSLLSRYEMHETNFIAIHKKVSLED